MPGRWNDVSAVQHDRHHDHSLAASRVASRPRLYDLVLRAAIASQHGLVSSDRLELRACEGCGKPCLLTSVWLPLSDEGVIGCPRCGAEAVEWDGARGYVAYWQREGGLRR